MITLEATVEQGQLKFKDPVLLAEGTPVRVTITPLSEDHPVNGPTTPEQAAAVPPTQPPDQSAAEEHPLDAVIGICTEGPDFSLAERHDEILYGRLKRRAGGQP